VEILNDDDVETTTEYCPIFFGVTRPSWTPTRSPSSMLLDSMGNYTTILTAKVLTAGSSVTPEAASAATATSSTIE
jgi:hypothetical protein